MGYNPALEPAAAALYADNAGMKAGPFILGFFVDAILMGILASHYFRWQTWSRPQESLPIKLLVWYTWIFAIAQTIFLVVLNMRVFGRLIVSLPGHHVADKGVYHFGRWAIFFDKSMVAWTPMLEAAARTPISIYFAARAYRLGRNSKLFIIVIAPLFLASFAGAVWAIVDQKDLFQNLMGKAPIYMWIGAEVASDVIITAFLSYHLIQSRTGWKQTDKMISRLLVLAIETQLPPTLFAFIFLIISAVDRHTPLGSFFCFIPKVYGISLLIILNKRYSLRREMEDETSTYKNNGKGTYGLRSRRGVSTGNIQVTTETIQHVDEFRPQASEGDVKDEPDSPRESTVQVLDYSSSETRLTKPSSDSSID